MGMVFWPAAARLIQQSGLEADAARALEALLHAEPLLGWRLDFAAHERDIVRLRIDASDRFDAAAGVLEIDARGLAAPDARVRLAALLAELPSPALRRIVEDFARHAGFAPDGTHPVADALADDALLRRRLGEAVDARRLRRIRAAMASSVLGEYDAVTGTYRVPARLLTVDAKPSRVARALRFADFIACYAQEPATRPVDVLSLQHALRTVPPLRELVCTLLDTGALRGVAAAPAGVATAAFEADDGVLRVAPLRGAADALVCSLAVVLGQAVASDAGSSPAHAHAAGRIAGWNAVVAYRRRSGLPASVSLLRERCVELRPLIDAGTGPDCAPAPGLRVTALGLEDTPAQRDAVAARLFGTPVATEGAA